MSDKKEERGKAKSEGKEKADKEKEGKEKESPEKGGEEKGKEDEGDEKRPEKESERAERKKKEKEEKERDKKDKKNKVPRQKRRPKDTAVWQQRIPAWTPILNAGTVLPLFFVLGLAFIPLGAGLLYFSSEVREKVVEYTDCRTSSEAGPNSGVRCSDVIDSSPDAECKCSVNFTLDHNFDGKVFMYYYLTNFYQNHRAYVRSRDNHQLHGDVNKDPIYDCKPFRYNDDGNKSKAIVPCGSIANSLFSDVLSLTSADRGGEVPLLKTGIAWPSDKKVKFKNPKGNLTQIFNKYSKPTKWKVSASELDPDDEDNNGLVNEDFLVWMRTAALSDFRKLYRKIDHSAEGYISGLSEGNYTLEVNYTFPVISFKGTKSIILSTTSLMGGKNPFLGVAFIVVGVVCICLAIVFLVLHLKYGKTAKELMHVNPHNPYQ